MHHTNRHDVIGSDDIQEVKHVHITEENGQKVAHIHAVLDPRKNYHESSEVYLHLTNGINHRIHGPFEHAKPITQHVEPTEGDPITEESETHQEPITSDSLTTGEPTTNKGKKGR